jgi:hypothetical protein
MYSRPEADVRRTGLALTLLQGVTHEFLARPKSRSRWRKSPLVETLSMVAVLVGSELSELRPKGPHSRLRSTYTTAISRRRSGAKSVFGIIACTPRTMSTTCVTRKLTPMLHKA